MLLIPLIATSAVSAAEVDRKAEPVTVARLRDRVAAPEPFVLSLDARGPYLLAATEAASQHYLEAIDGARKLHPGASEVVFAPGNLEAVREVFHNRRPRYAMVFILSDELDVRTGFITGQNPAAALGFAHRIRAFVESKTPLAGLAVDNLGPNAMAGIVHFGGHGYPDGIVDGLSAAQARDLKLGPCIVFNGACYTGVMGR
jgi:hypothetical protein